MIASVWCPWLCNSEVLRDQPDWNQTFAEWVEVQQSQDFPVDWCSSVAGLGGSTWSRIVGSFGHWRGFPDAFQIGPGVLPGSGFLVRAGWLSGVGSEIWDPNWARVVGTQIFYVKLCKHQHGHEKDHNLNSSLISWAVMLGPRCTIQSNAKTTCSVWLITVWLLKEHNILLFPS